MGRYIRWDDAVDRYPALNSLGGAEELSSYFIVYAEAFVDASLRSHYATPFSESNTLIRDLSIDVVFWKAGAHKLDEAEAVWSSFNVTIEKFKSGALIMVDDHGNEIPQTRTEPSMYSSTMGYHSKFGPDDPINWETDPEEIVAAWGDRE